MLPADLLARTGWSSRQVEQLYIRRRVVQTQRVKISNNRRADVRCERSKAFNFCNTARLSTW